MQSAAVIWAVVNELLIQPLEYTCFNLTLKKLQDDPRVTVRLGTPVSGYGQDSRSRQQRQRIPHRVYKDVNGTEKVQVRQSQNSFMPTQTWDVSKRDSIPCSESKSGLWIINVLGEEGRMQFIQVCIKAC